MFEDRPPATVEYLSVVQQLRDALIYSLTTCALTVSDDYLRLRTRLLEAAFQEEARVMAELREGTSSEANPA